MAMTKTYILAPDQSLQYTVKSSDTLERIAAMYDSTPTELMKLNKLVSRMVFPGQRIYVPNAELKQDTVKKYTEPKPSLVKETKNSKNANTKNEVVEMKFGNRPELSLDLDPPNEDHYSAPSADTAEVHKLPKSPTDGQVSPVPEDVLDAECLQRFIKLKVKHFTESEGMVNGVLLVTPNCVMFDPDLSHPLVKENGPERYGMIAKLEHLVSAGLYKDISAMTHEGPFCPVMHKDDMRVRSKSAGSADLKGDHVVVSTANAQTSRDDASVSTTTTNRMSLPPDWSDLPSTDGLGKPTRSALIADLPGGSSSTPLPSDSEASPPYAEGLCDGRNVASEGSSRLLQNIPEVCEPPLNLSHLIDAPVNPYKRHLSESDLPATSPTGRLPLCADVPSSNLMRCSNENTHHLSVSERSVDGQHDFCLSCPSSIERDSNERLNMDLDESELVLGRHRGERTRQTSSDVDNAFLEEEDAEGRRSSGDVNIRGKLGSLRDSMRKRKDLQAEKLAKMRKTFRRSLSTSAQTVSGALATGAHTVGGAITTGAHTVGGAITTGSTKVGDALTSGATVVGDALVSIPKNVAQVPKNIVNISSGLFSVDDEYEDVLDVQESWFSEVAQAPNNGARQRLKDEIEFRRHRSYAKLEELKVKAQQARTAAAAATQQQLQSAMEHSLTTPDSEGGEQSLRFTCATSKDEKPDLFTPIEEMVPQLGSSFPLTTEMPYFLCVRLDRRKRRHDHDPVLQFGNRAKTEFWFTVPTDKADSLYSFFIQWTPEKYGSDDSPSHRLVSGHFEGFVVIDSEEEDANLTKDDHSPFAPGSLSSMVPGSFLNREWEIVTVEEVKRRLSLADLTDITKFPLPEGSTNSTILKEDQIRKIVQILPARAECYPWVLVYSTTDHGYSLKTLYRNMASWAEEMSPTLLVIQDTLGHVFGAIINCPLVMGDHFYGTGESLLFSFYSEFQEYRWSGDNNFFVKGNPDSLSIGAGQGKYGLWLDGDFYHGRTQRCQTFQNECLTSSEDFIISSLEAFGFAMNF